MTTTKTPTCCILDCKSKPIMTCLGCPDLIYCNPHYQQHREELNKRLQNLSEACGKLLEDIKTQAGNPRLHILMRTVDEWEKNSIATITQMADRARQGLLPYVVDFIPRIKSQLNTLTEEVRHDRGFSEYVDTDINYWSKELDRLKWILDNPPYFTIREESTEFISKISLEAGGNPNIPPDARWLPNGITVAGSNGPGSSLNQFDRPLGLFVDDDQTIIVADQNNHRVMQWKIGDTQGKVVAGGRGQGSRLDQLSSPTDVVIDKETDSLIICDQGNRRVVRWSRRSDTVHGEIVLSNIGCSGITVDEQRFLYVSNTDKHEVRRYQIGDKTGTLVAGRHGQGPGLNQLDSPTAIFVDKQQCVYVADYYNHRVMKWPKGAKKGLIVAGGQGQGKSLTQLSLPQGLFVDSSGTVYVAESGNDRVTRWQKKSKQATVIAAGNGRGDEPNQLHWPVGLFFDRHSHLYVVDWGNNRVQRYFIEQIPLES